MDSQEYWLIFLFYIIAIILLNCWKYRKDSADSEERTHSVPIRTCDCDAELDTDENIPSSCIIPLNSVVNIEVIDTVNTPLLKTQSVEDLPPSYDEVMSSSTVSHLPPCYSAIMK